MNKISNTPENIFRLLVPASDLTPPDATFIEFCGNRWVLAEFARISDAPPYTCISYSWGGGRTENPFEAGQLMSDRTLPAIEVTINASQSPEHWGWALMQSTRDAQKEAAALSAALKASQAIWIDALCVPSQDPARAACLRSMGAIYSSATQVFAVLSETCSKLLHKIHSKERMSFDDLIALEKDDWITRAWTYQESANSKNTLFIAQGDGHVLIHEHDFLNAILTGTTDYAKEQGVELTEFSVQFPRLDSLQEMIAEHKLVEFVGRPAYQVMSAMHQRFAEREEDRLYAMIGVVSDLPSVSLDDVSIKPAEYFMRVCEEKGDFSFIYSVAARSEIPGKCWRPIAEKLPPVISGYLPVGHGQTGYLKETHLQLNNMYRLSPGAVIPDAIKSVRSFLRDNNTDSSEDNVADAIFERLKQKGFLGCGDRIELDNGLFFPQSTFTPSNGTFVAISQDVMWAGGGPGLLLESNGTDINRYCDVGVFVGRYPKVSESINVG